jgi:gamma-glutamyl hercynylcysteine S-oxide synthase
MSAPATDTTLDRASVADALERARHRTLGLVDLLSEPEQRAQVSLLMSPSVWDLAHIGNYEELWLLRALDGRAAIDPALDDLYNAFEHPRWERPSLPILGPDQARAYLRQVRDQVLDLLEALDPARLDGEPARLVDQGFVYGMVVQHEHQHDETLLATHQLRGPGVAAPPSLGPSPSHSFRPADPAREGRDLSPEAVVVDGMCRIPGGAFVMGTSTEAWAYDNEHQAHVLDLGEYLIDATAVTTRDYLAFVDDGGYDDPRLWATAGWTSRLDGDLAHPQFWARAGDGAWTLRRFGRTLDLADHLDEPVQHVSWYEADAFARWAGKRLPTEAEWEKAAVGAPGGGRSSRWPWGDRSPTDHEANLGQVGDGPRPVSGGRAGASRWGVTGLIGDVWEWTSSDFRPYPGFEAWPYREYSEVFWGDEYKVLRGGSWATDPSAVRGSFRNWDLPIRRQIFAGFRCARDA